MINLKKPATPPLFCFRLLNKHNRGFISKSKAQLYKCLGSCFKVAKGLPFLFVTLALLLLIGCGLAEQNSSVIQSSEVNALNEQIAEKKTELSSLRSSSGGRSSRSRRNVRRSAELEQEIADLTVAQQPVIVQSLVATGTNVEDYIPTVVYLYSIVGRCNSASDESAHKSCTTACYDPSFAGNLKQCVDICDARNSKACETLGAVCSGVFQEANHILTNHHCVEADIGSYTKKGKHYYSIQGTAVENKSRQKTMLKTVKWYDKTADVALVELNKSLSNAKRADLTGSVSELSLLDVLFTIGQPTPGLTPIKWTASAGYLTNKEPGLCGGRCIAYSIPVGGGNSGGPVFNSKGKLVALIAKTITDYNNLSFGPHIDRINHLISQPPAPGSSDFSGTLSSFQNLQAEGFFDLSSSAQEQRLEAIKELAIELADD